MFKNFLIAILIPLNVYAQDAVSLHKGSYAPFDGVLITKEKAQQLKSESEELSNTKLINESLNKSLKLHVDISSMNAEKYNIVSEQNDKLAKALRDQQSVNSWERIGWFVLGVVTVGIAAYAVGQANK